MIIIPTNVSSAIPYLLELCMHALSSPAAAPQLVVGRGSAANVGWLRTLLHTAYSCGSDLKVHFHFSPKANLSEDYFNTLLIRLGYLLCDVLYKALEYSFLFT